MDIKTESIVQASRVAGSVTIITGGALSFYTSALLLSIRIQFNGSLDDITGPVKLLCSLALFNSPLLVKAKEKCNNMDATVVGGLCSFDVTIPCPTFMLL